MFMSTEGLRATREIIVYGPEICGDCSRVIKKFADKGILVTKVVIDSDHEVVTALRQGGGKVVTPIVYVDSQYAFNGLNPARLLEVINEELALLLEMDLVNA